MSLFLIPPKAAARFELVLGRGAQPRPCGRCGDAPPSLVERLLSLSALLSPAPTMALRLRRPSQRRNPPGVRRQSLFRASGREAAVF